MIGYASGETKELMPLTHLLANKVAERINEVREEGICKWMGPDAKVQITIEYKQE